MACLVLGILMAYFFAIPTAISLYATVFHIAALATLFYCYKQKKITSIRLVIFSLLSILFIDGLTTGFHQEKQMPTVALALIKNAEKYQGTRYKHGGTTKKGMDCSGLIRTIFKEENIPLPRASHEMAKRGEWIALKEIKVGDLLFFTTKKRNPRINHVGLVTTIKGDTITFIHATTSQGVITSKLTEKYWLLAFVQARRVL
jgi:hypothetical protein